MQTFDVQVHGNGIVGHALALALAGQGLRVALHAEPAATEVAGDVRAYALNAASVALLRRLKVWDGLPVHSATPVHDMRVEGDAPGAVLEFSGWEQRAGELAWIVDAAALLAQLAAALRFSPHITLTNTDVAAPLVALCEGKSSARRDALGVAFPRQAYGHRAIAARLTAHAGSDGSTPVPHQNTARQWFRSPDVLALLPLDTPLPGASYALVWSMPDAQADDLQAASDAEFEQALNRATGGAAGTLALASPRMAWPLLRATASAWCGPGWALLGDAAHVVHPLAGQGLNLGLADVAALARVLAEREPWRPLGDTRLLRRYARERLAPTQAMSQLTDGLLRLFATPAPAVRELRNRGLGLVNAAGPLKRWLTARALGT